MNDIKSSQLLFIFALRCFVKRRSTVLFYLRLSIYNISYRLIALALLWLLNDGSKLKAILLESWIPFVNLGMSTRVYLIGTFWLHRVKYRTYFIILYCIFYFADLFAKLELLWDSVGVQASVKLPTCVLISPYMLINLLLITYPHNLHILRRNIMRLALIRWIERFMLISSFTLSPKLIELREPFTWTFLNLVLILDLLINDLFRYLFALFSQALEFIVWVVLIAFSAFNFWILMAPKHPLQEGEFIWAILQLVLPELRGNIDFVCLAGALLLRLLSKVTEWLFGTCLLLDQLEDRTDENWSVVWLLWDRWVRLSSLIGVQLIPRGLVSDLIDLIVIYRLNDPSSGPVLMRYQVLRNLHAHVL